MYLYILINTDIYLCRYVHGQIDRQTDKHLDRQIYTLRAVGWVVGRPKWSSRKPAASSSVWVSGFSGFSVVGRALGLVILDLKP